MGGEDNGANKVSNSKDCLEQSICSSDMKKLSGIGSPDQKRTTVAGEGTNNDV